MNEFDKQSSEFTFLKSTISFIAATILIIIFFFIVYGFAIDDKVFDRLGDYTANMLRRFLIWVSEYIILPIALFLGFMRFIVWVFSGESEAVYEYDVEVKSSPTPQKTLANIPPEPQILTSINGSRGDERFDFGKYTPGSNEAAIAYRNSQEYKDNQNKLRTLDDAIKEARKYVAG